MNPYSYLRLRSDPDVLDRFTHVYFDGISLVRVACLMRIPTERRSFDFTSLASTVFTQAAARQASVALVGGVEGIAAEAAKQIEASFPGIRITYTKSGFFVSPDERTSALALIARSQPDYLIIGMGTPAQETFLADAVAAGWSGVGYTCGGFFHQTAAAGGRYYPAWIDRLQLRWAYRIWKEPNTRRRYLMDYPRGLVAFIADNLRHHITLRRERQVVDSSS